MNSIEKKREVPVSELVLSLSYQFEAIVRLLERKAMLSREELIAEIRVIMALEEKGKRG
jgi:hypothetical protein